MSTITHTAAERKAAQQAALAEEKLPELSLAKKKEFADQQWGRICHWACCTDAKDSSTRLKKFTSMLDPRVVDAAKVAEWTKALTDKGFIVKVVGPMLTVTLPA